MIDLAKEGDEETVNSWITVSPLLLSGYYRKVLLIRAKPSITLNDQDGISPYNITRLSSR